MQVTTQVLGDEVEVAVSGSVDNESSPELRRALDRILTKAVRRIQIDLADVRYMSSAGVAVLLETRQRLLDQHGQLAIPQASHEVRQVLAACRLEELLLS